MISTIITTSPQYCKQAINVYKQAFSQNMRLNMKLIKKYIKHHIYQINILSDESKAVFGFAFLIPLEKYSLNNVVHIDYLAIDPNHQGKGYAGKLMNDIIKQNADKALTLECENHLIKLYEKFNFVKICEYQFRGRQMNFMLRGTLKQGMRQKILGLLHTIQNPELYISGIVPDTFVEKLTHSIGVIKIYNIYYSKYDAWIRKRIDRHALS